MAGKCPVCSEEYTGELAFCARDGTKLRPFDEEFGTMGLGDPLIGVLVGGRYRILKRIGEGGMGVVYIAEHEAIEKKVAIKILKDKYAIREDVVARFQQEAKSASRVKHSGVLEVFDFGRTEDLRFYIAMELLDGRDLSQLLESEVQLPPLRVVRIGVQVARALAAAHGKGIIHRDLKPENIFIRIGDDGREYVKIVDFGIAQLRAEGEDAADPNAKVSGRKLTKTGVIFGTPEYMSPEQAAGRPIDARVDVYALGVILYELLSGITPFQGDTFMAILSAHVMKPIPELPRNLRPGFTCSPELEAVVGKALAKEPDQRFRNMNDVADALLATPEGAIDETLKPVGPRFVSAAPPASPGFIAGTDLRLAPTVMGELNELTVPPGAVSSGSTEGTIAEVVPKKRSGPAIAIGAAVMTLGAGALVLTMRASPPPPPIHARPVETPVASTPQPVLSAPAIASGSASPEAPQVSIHVETSPAGAIIEREVGTDWLQVCDKSPCDVSVAQGSAVHLRATLAGRRTDAKILAAQPQRVAMTIPTAQKTPAKPAGENLCEVILEEGIKVWRPCPKK